jgi:dTDP-glucose 4,6-dehydratase
MRILITGGAGFLGSHLCDRFLAEGHQVIAMDNLITGTTRNIEHLAGRDDFLFIKHDVTHYINVEGPLDAILHFASPASPVDYLELPIQTLKVGALGTHKALGLAMAKKARFLLTMAYHRAHGVETRIARIFNTYGPRMRLDDGRVVPNFVGQALRGEPLTVYGDGSQTRSFCYVDDLIEGIYHLLLSDEVEPVNLGNPTEMAILDFAHLVNRLTGNKAGIVYEDYRIPDDPQVRQPDISKARRVLNWEPKVDLKEGLQKTIEWFRERVQ